MYNKYINTYTFNALNVLTDYGCVALKYPNAKTSSSIFGTVQYINC